MKDMTHGCFAKFGTTINLLAVSVTQVGNLMARRYYILLWQGIIILSYGGTDQFQPSLLQKTLHADEGLAQKCTALWLSALKGFLLQNSTACSMLMAPTGRVAEIWLLLGAASKPLMQEGRIQHLPPRCQPASNPLCA